jgi:hypothetical protein
VAKTDKIDAWVLAELARRELVPAIWLPDPTVRAERERARFRLHLVRLRTALKNRIHATLITFGHPLPVSDLFGVAGRGLLASLAIPEPWATTLATSLSLVDELDRQIERRERELRAMGADHPDVALLRTLPGVAWVLGYTLAAEIGDIGRLAGAKQSVGYTGLWPRVRQSGTRDDRDRSPSRVPSTCAGRSSRPPPTPPAIPATGIATNAPGAGWAVSVGRPSPVSSSPASWRPPSGTCSPNASRLHRQAPFVLWSLDDPVLRWAAAASDPTWSSLEEAIKR